MKFNHSVMKAMTSKVRGCIPPQIYGTIGCLDRINPGYDGEAIQFIFNEFEHLKNGGILVLSGSIGTGKTTAAVLGIMCAARKRLHIPKSHDEFGDEIFSDIKDWGENVALKTGYQVLSEAFEHRECVYNYESCLVLDDMGREHFIKKGWGASVWESLIDHRYSEQLSTVITTNLTLPEFSDKYGAHIYDRLKEAGKWYNIKHASLRG